MRGNNSTSDKIEYLPPTYSLCSIKNKLSFFDSLKRKLFFSEIKIIFFVFFLIIFNEKRLDKVSIVFPDYEIIINRVCGKIFFFLNLINLFSLIS